MKISENAGAVHIEQVTSQQFDDIREKLIDQVTAPLMVAADYSKGRDSILLSLTPVPDDRDADAVKSLPPEVRKQITTIIMEVMGA